MFCVHVVCCVFVRTWWVVFLCARGGLCFCAHVVGCVFVCTWWVVFLCPWDGWNDMKSLSTAEGERGHAIHVVSSAVNTPLMIVTISLMIVCEMRGILKPMHSGGL